MAEIILWPSNARTIGYDHSSFRMPVRGVTDVLRFTDVQQQMAEQQLRALGAEALPIMLQVATDRRISRDNWEESTLRAMGIHPTNPSDILFQEYLERAGNPRTMAELIVWFGKHSGPLAGGKPDWGVVVDGLGHMEQQDAIEEASGKAIELGTAMRMGDIAASQVVSDTLDDALEELEPYALSVVGYNPDQIPVGKRHHKLVPLYSGQAEHYEFSENYSYKLINMDINALVALHVIRERLYAKVILPLAMGRICVLDITKRTETILPTATLGIEVERALMNSLSNSSDITPPAQFSEDITGYVMKVYEQLVHSIRAQQKFGIQVAPLSMTYRVGNSTEIDVR